MSQMEIRVQVNFQREIKKNSELIHLRSWNTDVTIWRHVQHSAVMFLLKGALKQRFH